MAIGVVIGAAFGKITTSLVNDIIMPLIGLITGGIDLTQRNIVLNKTAVAAGDAAPVMLGIGNLLAVILDFIIVAFAMFLLVKAMNKLAALKRLLERTLSYNQKLKAFGVNVNFAPVCDVSTNPDNFIYARSFGQDAQTTADYISSVVPVYAQSGIACVLKHFPGYGNNADTHTGIALDARPYTTFEQSDLVPFESGIAAGAPFVLVSHNIVECMDGAYPASLSAKVHTLLRDTLGFTGVIVTDDLAMDAVKAYAQDGSAGVLAIQAGNDMIVTTDYQTQIPQVIAAVRSGEIAESEIDAHVFRVLHEKQALGLID